MSEKEQVYISSVSEYITKVQSLAKQKKRYSIPEINKLYSTVISDIDPELVIIGRKYVDAIIHDKRNLDAIQEPKYFYRGHYSTAYKLIPSVFRGANWKKEDYYYHEMAVRSPEHFQGKTHLDKLVTMQHYDCPTRLLDVTSNPLVALYFACKNYGCSKCNSSDEGVVYMFPVFPKDVVYSDSDRALMLSCLARFSKEEKEEIWRQAFSSIKASDLPKNKGNHEYSAKEVEKLYHEITREVPSFKRTMHPIDLLKPLVVQPNKTNARIMKQDGAFILCGLSSCEAEAQDKIERMVQTEIHVLNQNEILKELDALGINEATLFPELDKVAKYLKEH